MSTSDTCCSILPYFSVHEGKMDNFKKICEKFIEHTKEEKRCLYYGFSFNNNTVRCREGYENAEGVLEHLENVGELLEKALTISELAKLEIHGPEEEIAKLREPLAHLNPQYFILEYGFRRELVY